MLSGKTSNCGSLFLVVLQTQFKPCPNANHKPHPKTPASHHHVTQVLSVCEGLQRNKLKPKSPQTSPVQSGLAVTQASSGVASPTATEWRAAWSSTALAAVWQELGQQLEPAQPSPSASSSPSVECASPGGWGGGNM